MGIESTFKTQPIGGPPLPDVRSRVPDALDVKASPERQPPRPTPITDVLPVPGLPMLTKFVRISAFRFLVCWPQLTIGRSTWLPS